MVVAGNTLFVAAPRGDWLTSPAVYEGTEGVVLGVLSTEDGKSLVEYKLPASPIYDGLSAAAGRLYVSLENGDVVCWGAAAR